MIVKAGFDFTYHIEYLHRLGSMGLTLHTHSRLYTAMGHNRSILLGLHIYDSNRRGLECETKRATGTMSPGELSIPRIENECHS